MNTVNKFEGFYIKKIGLNRGIPRVWLEGSQTERAGFMPGQRYDVTVEGQTVVLQANTDGSRVVSSKKAGESRNPVIDLNSRELLAIFDGMASIRVVVKKGEIILVPLASEIKKKERFNRLREKLEAGDPLTIGSLSHGGGILTHAIHTGLGNAGIKSELRFANEIRPELLEHAAVHNDAWNEKTMLFAAPMQELAFDERGLSLIPRVEILEMGLPCTGASPAGMAKNALSRPEAHPEVGHLVVSALVILSKTNAAVVILENVPHYAQTASADILRTQLRDMGYVTHERILNGKQWGALENRDRWCMVAVTQGIRSNETGEFLDAGAGGISTESVPKMQAIQSILESIKEDSSIITLYPREDFSSPLMTTVIGVSERGFWVEALQSSRSNQMLMRCRSAVVIGSCKQGAINIKVSRPQRWEFDGMDSFYLPLPQPMMVMSAPVLAC